jgi:transglutaminase-like putative cysteine protease
MRPSSDARELVQAADCAGCRVLAKSRLDMGDGSSLPVLELECGDNVTAIRFLNHAALKDTGDPEVRDLALRLLAAHPDQLPQAVHVFVKIVVRFVREKTETFQHTKYTLRRRAGDCDDHARCVVALVLAGGGKARIVGVPNREGKVAHVAPQTFHDGAWRWAETTVDAAFGEHPRMAARRLGLNRQRPDVA